MTTARPFEGLRIVDLGTFWAAPYLTCYLGAMGADVVKVESIQRPDGFRFSATFPQLGEAWHERSLLWQGTNLNKRGITLDLGSEDGRALLRRLCAEGDVFVENYSARVVEQFGLGYEQLRELNPRMIVLRLPGFGLEGPWRDYVGWGNAFEQVAGMCWVTGFPDGPPLNPGGYIDPTVGMHAGVALLAALEHRERTGEGQLIEVAQIEVGACLTAEQVIAHSTNGTVPSRQGNRSSRFAPQGVYGCEDGRNIALSVRDDAEWASLVETMGHPDGADDADLRLTGGRHRRHDDIDRMIDAWTSTCSAGEVEALLIQRGIPVATVLQVEEHYEEPNLARREYYERVDHPLVGERRFPGFPMKFWFSSSGHHVRHAPTLGEHNEEILHEELGLSADEVGELTQAGVIGTEPAGLRT